MHLSMQFNTFENKTISPTSIILFIIGRWERSRRQPASDGRKKERTKGHLGVLHVPALVRYIIPVKQNIAFVSLSFRWWCVFSNSHNRLTGLTAATYIVALRIHLWIAHEPRRHLWGPLLGLSSYNFPYLIFLDLAFCCLCLPGLSWSNVGFAVARGKCEDIWPHVLPCTPQAGGQKPELWGH
jgi:hypothetical protein